MNRDCTVYNTLLMIILPLPVSQLSKIFVSFEPKRFGLLTLRRIRKNEYQANNLLGTIY